MTAIKNKEEEKEDSLMVKETDFYLKHGSHHLNER